MSHDYEHKEPQQQQQQQSQTQHPLAPGPSHSPHALAPAPAPAPAPPPAGASPTSAGAGLGLGLGNPFLRARSDLQQEQHFGSSFSLPQHLPDFATPGTSSLEQQQQQYQDAPLLTSFPNLASVQATLSALAPSPGFPPGDMHQGSVLSTRPPHLPTGGGLRSALAGLHTSAIGTSSMQMAGMMSLHQPSLHLEQLEHQAPHPPPAMDDFFDQMFSFSSPWTEIGGRSSWDYDANAGAASTAPDAGSVPPPKLFTMSLMPPGESLHYGTDERHDPSMVTRLSHQHQLHHQDLPALAPGSGRLQRSPSVGSSGSEGSPGQQQQQQQQQHAPRDQSPPPIAPTWRQPYVGGVPPLPMASLGDAATSEALLGKRGRDEEDMSRDGRSAGSTHGNAPSQGLSPPMQGGQIYGAPPGLAPHQPAAPVVARPRVRARRGQATDPHSIAERLRRERIAERMKALQELVPNSNKTDKASMLDEIIDYVKFLQLQVKVLSMSRLGGAGAVAPLVADLPSEGPSSFVAASIGRSGAASGPASEGLALTEREVARLMEEDMGTAMQYLQSKGLCLMPISLATAISSNGPRPQTAGGAHGTPAPGLMSSSAERQRQEQSVAMSSSPGVPGLPAAARVTRDTWEAGSGDKANPGSAESTKSPAAGSKPTLDSPRRGQ